MSIWGRISYWLKKYIAPCLYLRRVHLSGNLRSMDHVEHIAKASEESALAHKLDKLCRGNRWRRIRPIVPDVRRRQAKLVSIFIYESGRVPMDDLVSHLRYFTSQGL